MKKFWHSGHLNISGEIGDHEQPVGNINLAYVHEVRRQSVLEVISEGSSEDEREQTFSKSSGTPGGKAENDAFHVDRELKGVVGFKLSPQLTKSHPRRDSIQVEESGSDDEESAQAQREIDIWDRPKAGISRAEILPYLLEKMNEVEDACVDENCPYNRWLYAGKEHPDRSELDEWEVSKLRDFSIPRPSISGFEISSDSKSRVNISSFEGSKVSKASNSVMESTKMSQDLNLNRSSKHKDLFTALPRTNSTSISSSDSIRSFSTVPIESNASTYPIITLSTRSRQTEKKRTSSLCCFPVSGNRSEDEYKSYPLKELSRPPSSCSCSHSYSSSCSSCSTCILEHEDPTAPHAFTVQGRINIRFSEILFFNYVLFESFKRDIGRHC